MKPFTVKLTMEIEKNANHFATFTANYSAMDLQDVVELEQLVIGGLLQAGVEKVAKK